jgi:serine/threonine protein kinase
MSAPNFGKYQILDRIAVGGMAEIYKARMDGLGGFHRTLAIKRILPALADNPDFVEMLVEEAKVAGLLSHANIVQILDLGQVEGNYFIAMEYVDGPDLGRVLQRCRSKKAVLPVPHSVFILNGVLKALEYAHDRQVMRGGQAVPLDIVHRDICPANVLISYKGEIKLTDFGIAKASVRSLDTLSGVVKGRFDYLSPEQARGERADQRTDLFSAGVLLYEMLTGQHPFSKPRQPDTLAAIKSCSFRPPSHLNPEVPAALDLLISQTLHPDPGQRFHSATAMKEALDRFFHESEFIFSHSTLAAYLRGLFPESEATNQHNQSSQDEADLETRPILRSELHAEDQPTHEVGPNPASPRRFGAPGDTTLRRLPLNLSGVKDYAASSVFGPLGEDNTIVGPAPDLDQREWAEAETIIRPILSDLDTDMVTGTGSQPAPSAQSGNSSELDLPLPEPGPRQPPRTKPASAQAPRGQILSLAIGIVIVVAALLVGFLLGSQAAKLTGIGPEPVTVNSDPVLEVHMPPDGVLHVNGFKIPGISPVSKRLVPGRSHEIRVTIPDHLPVETSIRLESNDLRILNIEHVQTQTRPEQERTNKRRRSRRR